MVPSASSLTRNPVRPNSVYRTGVSLFAGEASELADDASELAGAAGDARSWSALEGKHPPGRRTPGRTAVRPAQVPGER
ncbi:hypothetical protein GCM10010360_39000 [Streptomyces nogalater]